MLRFYWLRPIRHGPGRWLAAFGLIAIVAVLNVGYLRLTSGANQFTLFYPALIAAALYSGRVPTYAALLAVVVGASTFWLPPIGRSLAFDPAALWALLAFVLVSMLMIETALAARRSTDRLERQRAELETMLNLIPVGIAVAHDAKAERITVTPGLAAQMGFSSDDNVSKSGPEGDRLPFRVYADGRELAPDELPVQRACRTGREIRDADVELVFVDGRRIELMISAAPLFDENGDVRGAIAAHVDITRLKDVQRSLDEASRQKDVFLATLAHELRNPMAPIRYAAALLRPDVAAPTIAQARALIERQAAHMGRLLDDLLDVSRITRNAIELKSETLDLREVVSSTVDVVRSEVEQRRHRLECELPPVPVWIDGDPDRLHQIVLNLLTNANKYTEPGGRIHVALSAAAGRASLTIADTGIGLTPEMIARMFDLFAQVHPGRGSGLGIGLSVVRRLVELHGGTVAVSSAGLGHGASFAVTLPLAVAPAAVAATAGTSVVPLFQAAPRVVVIDDNRDAADALAAVLRSHGLSTQVAYAGDDGMALAEEHRPDVIVLDIGMPGASGYDVARWVRAQPWGRTIALIAVTGWGQAQDRRHGHAAGFDDHLVKPVDPDELLARLGAAARSRQDAALSAG